MRPARHESLRRDEAAWLAAIVAAAILTRLLWCAGDVPHFWFGEANTLWIADLIDRGAPWRQWQSSLASTQVGWPHESAVMMPVAVAFQRLLGPSLHLQAEVGAFWGVLAVAVAWWVGRSVHSPLFGLVFAALVAASPLQITWSRLGGLHVGAPFHVLLVLALGVAAGARGSVVLALVAGAAAWASVYQYYAARVALPLVFVALLAGFRLGRPRLPRAIVLLAACALAVGALGAAALHLMRGLGGLWAHVWPQYIGYVGNRGPQPAAQVVADMLSALRAELPRAMRAYFRADRAVDQVSGTTMSGPASILAGYSAQGGLCLLPVAALGAIGAAVALVRWRRDVLWLALAAFGLLVPCLSTTTARRFLVFDLGWCALAAGGLVALVGAGSLRSRPARVGLLLALALTGYSFAVVIALGARLPPGPHVAIPFGESGFGDGHTCLACARHARRWEDAIRGGAFVVLFDTDVQRENRTSPAGLPLYGKIAALATGKPHSFVDYYMLVGNFDVDPPRGGQLYDPGRVDFAAQLAAAVERERPDEIRWEFVQPTQWERWLAERLLTTPGAERRPLDDPSLATAALHEADPGFEVVTPWTARADALAVVSELAGTAHAEDRCVRLDVLGREHHPVPVIVLAPRSGRTPRWTVGSFHVIRHDGHEAAVGDAVGLVVDAEADGSERLDILTRFADRVAYDPTTATAAHANARFSPPLGPDCAVRLGDEWWVLDPIQGRLARASGGWTPPAGRWVGIAGDPAGNLILAAADQTLHVFDVGAGREVQSFAARVAPSRRFYFGECSPVVAGEGWIATLDHLHRKLSVYDQDGRPHGEVVLDAVPPMVEDQPSTVAATGREIGASAGYGGTVVTLGLGFVPDCSPSR